MNVFAHVPQVRILPEPPLPCYHLQMEQNKKEESLPPGCYLDRILPEEWTEKDLAELGSPENKEKHDKEEKSEESPRE